MLHMTQSSHRHVDGVREVVGSSIRLNPLKKWEATTAFYVQEASPDSYFETDDDELCIPFLEGSALYFNGALPHHSVLKSGSVKLLGPFQLSSLKSVGEFGTTWCDPSLPCGPGKEIFSCPCANGTSVPSLGKSGKSPSGTPVCGNDDLGNSFNPTDNPECCGVEGYEPCWNVQYPYYECDGGFGVEPTGSPACCGFGGYPPCGSSLSSGGKSGKSSSLATNTTTCGNADGFPEPNSPCCGFQNFWPCASQKPCGFGPYPPCAGGFSGKSGKGGYPNAIGAPNGTATPPAIIGMEQLSAEVDGAEGLSVSFSPDETAYSFDFDV
jgi:hypothetical protein